MTVLHGVAVAVASVVAALALRAWLDPLVGNQFLFSFIYASIAFTVWYAGPWPALVAIVLGFIGADYLFLEPRYVFSFGLRAFDLIAAVTYFSTSATIWLLGTSLHTREARLGIEVRRVRAQTERLEAEAVKREAAQEALRKSEDLLRRVTEALPVGLWIANGRGQIEHGNPAALEIWRGARYVGPERFGEYKGWWVKTGKLIAPEEWAVTRAINKGETSINEEIEIECFDGTRKIILNSAIPIRQKEGITGAIIVNQDITARKRNDMELQAARKQLEGYAAELEQRVAERTAHLEQTVRSLEGILYHIAHDLRAPIRAMSGFSSILLTAYAEGMDQTGRDYLENIAQAALRMDRLILDLLSYGRLGHMRVEMGRVDLRDILDRCVEELSPEILRTSAHINIAEHLHDVTGNVTLLKSALTNLLSNALKYVGHGVVPEVRIWSERAADKVRILVADNGVGIEPQYQEKIFQIFERIPSHAVRTPGEEAGTGIGLAIVKQAAERMGGCVGVESHPGSGSCFWIELPSLRAENAPVGTESMSGTLVAI